MNLDIAKIRGLELSLSRSRGDFELFCVILREALPDRWDLVVSAPWLYPDHRESLQLMAAAVNETFPSDEVVGFSRIAILDRGEPFLEIMLNMVNVEHGLQGDCTVNYSPNKTLCK